MAFFVKGHKNVFLMISTTCFLNFVSFERNIVLSIQSIFTYQSGPASVFLESGVTVLNHFLLTKFLQAGTVIFLFIFFDSVFTAHQDYITHFESSQS